MDDTEIRLTCGNLARTRELIRSLRDDEQVKSQEPASAGGCVPMTKASSRSVAFWSAISRTRWTFLEPNVPVVVSLMVPLVTPLDEMQMKPRLMMAALITGT